MAGLNGISTLTTGHNLNVSGVSSAPETKASNAAPVNANTGSVTDKASVSSTGGLVAQALNTSDVRLDKVAQLQSAIASGSYQVSSSDVASKIVDSLLK